MSRSRVMQSLAAGLVIIGAGLLFLATSRSDSPIEHAATAPTELGCGGSLTTLIEAAGSMPFTLELPNTSIANAANIKQVLLCASDQVEIDFSSGVILTLGTNHLANPADEWSKLAQDYPEFSTGTVRGVPASLADSAKGALGGVDLVQNGVRITVTGNGSIPLTDLVDVAESIQPIASPTPTPSV